MLEFSNVKVLRRNHVGDWGTQFGILIEFLFEKFPDWENSIDQAIGDFQAFYKTARERYEASKDAEKKTNKKYQKKGYKTSQGRIETSQQRSDSDVVIKDDFAVRARQAVVKLQAGEKKYQKAWKEMCEISRKSCEMVYKRLDIHSVEQGESFYHPYIPMVLKLLEDKRLIVESEGARVLNIKSNNPEPFIVVKQDGGFNYASTDITALWYRLEVEKVEWILYITGEEQTYHFGMVFETAKLAGWLPREANPRAYHVKVGLVTGQNGFLRSREGSERLTDLLDLAKSHCRDHFIKEGKNLVWSKEQLDEAAEALGTGIIRYADLQRKIYIGYDYEKVFNVEEILKKPKGNNAVYLLKAYSRICLLTRDVEDLKKVGKIELIEDGERHLGLHLLRFTEVVQDACTSFSPNLLCNYLYDLSRMVTRLYGNSTCQVVGSEARIGLCVATKVVMSKCFHFLGITPIYSLCL